VTFLLNQLVFLFQRLDWLDVLDILLVTAIFFIVLTLVRDTHAMVLMRGVIFFAIVLMLLTSLVNLPAFSWFVSTVLPALIVSVPVVFAPEIRRVLERLGRAGNGVVFWRQPRTTNEAVMETIQTIVTSAARLSVHQYGALIILQGAISLEEYAETGVPMDATPTPELMLQIFYPNTPLHDGAVIVSDECRVSAASCVMPLSSSGVLNRSPERQMGLRHRAALGSSEASDAIAVVVSEETGDISVAQGGRLIHRLDRERLENILMAFYRTSDLETSSGDFFARLFANLRHRRRED
jgi:diadenylate cyclase